MKNILLMAVVLMLAMAACSTRPTEPAKDASSVDSGQASVKPASQAVSAPADREPPAHIDGNRAMQYLREVVAFGPRPVGSEAHKKLEAYIHQHLKGMDVEDDRFTVQSNGKGYPIDNIVAKIPGKKDGILVIAGHYDTKPVPGFVGANDGGSSTALPLELARQYAAQAQGGKLDGCSVWIAFLDGEESIQQSNDMDLSNSMYGSQHMANKWQQDGTLKKVKAFLLVDMVGDADLDILRDSDSTGWLEDLIYEAAKRLGYQSHFFAMQTEMEDDHIPFVKKNVPSADLIDFDYGYNNVFWHSPQDTVDKLSAQSLQIVGDVVMETVRMVDSR